MTVGQHITFDENNRSGAYQRVMARAERYWQNAPNAEGPPITEMLVDGNVEVIRVVRTFNANLPE